MVNSRLLMFLGLVLVLAGCSDDSSTMDNPGEASAEVYLIGDDDQLMQAAIKQANEAAEHFVRVLGDSRYQEATFACRVRLEEGDQAAHLWVTFRSDHTVEKGKYLGVIVEAPKDWTLWMAGEQALVDLNAIVDWRVIRGDEIEGGFTTRVFRDRMTEAQREQFDKKLGVRFDAQK